jgi:hypothetical protein
MSPPVQTELKPGAVRESSLQRAARCTSPESVVHRKNAAHILARPRAGCEVSVQ